MAYFKKKHYITDINRMELSSLPVIYALFVYHITSKMSHSRIFGALIKNVCTLVK